MQAFVVGATGLVGRQLLAELVAEPRVERIVAVTRRPLDLSHEKLEVLVTELDELEDALAKRQATHAFCCLGTTIAKAGSQAAFRHVDHDLSLAFGRACVEAGVEKLLVVTALGADPRSRVFYNRVKGELERDLAALGLPELHLLRPSLLLGEREERRRAEALAMALAKPLGALLAGPLAKYRAIDASDVAKALLAFALEPKSSQAVTIHESDAIRERALAARDHTGDRSVGP